MRRRWLVLPFGTLTGLLASGYGVVFTVLDDFRDEYGISETALGAIIAIGFFAGFVAQFTIAPFADRGHARRLVFAGMFLNVAGLVVMAFGTTVVALLAGRLIAGIGIGTTMPAARRIVILADPERVGHNLGRLLSADVAGFAAGPAVSAVLVGPLGIGAPFLVIAVATLAVLPMVWRVHVDESVAGTSPRFALDLLRVRPLAGALVLGAAVFLMIGAFDALWAVVLDDLEAADWVANLGITLFALPLIVLASAGGRLAQRVGPFRVATAGLVGGAVFMAMYGLVGTWGAMFAVAMVHALNDGLTIASTGVAVAVAAPPDRQAGAQGLLGGFQTLTAGVAAMVTGALYEGSGRSTAYLVAALAMVAMIVVGVTLSWPAWRRGDRDAVTPVPSVAAGN